MNVKEACKTLGITEGSSKDDAKKAFRKLAAKYHPDVNKDAGAEDQFKKINEAWRVVDSGQSSTREEQQTWTPWQGGSWNNIQDFFNNNFGGRPQKRIFAEDIVIQQMLSFKESVIGTTKNITYKRNIKCVICNGTGSQIVDNGCDICHGAGRVRTQINPTTFSDRICNKCHGRANQTSCDKCKTNGFTEAETIISVNIPPGAIDGSKLSLGARGNYMGEMFGSEQNSHLTLLISVIPETGLFVRNNDVISEMKISLLEAFRGCVKSIPTIDGDKEIDIPKLIKNKEEVVLPNLGVARKGKQIVVVYVNYPNNIDSLITVLDKDK